MNKIIIFLTFLFSSVIPSYAQFNPCNCEETTPKAKPYISIAIHETHYDLYSKGKYEIDLDYIISWEKVYIEDS